MAIGWEKAINVGERNKWALTSSEKIALQEGTKDVSEEITVREVEEIVL